jgi:hypothetical protein
MFPRIIEVSLKSRKCPCRKCRERGGCLPSTLAFVSEESKAETELLYTKLPFIRDGREIYSYNINFEIDIVCCSQRHFGLIEASDPESELPDWVGDIQKLGFPLRSKSIIVDLVGVYLEFTVGWATRGRGGCGRLFIFVSRKLNS